MRLQCGMLHRDGRVASKHDVKALVGPSLMWNSEMAGEVVSGPLVMVYRGDRVTIEDEYESQPVRCGSWLMTWDGRLDNRQDIATRAALKLTNTISDAELVGRALNAVGDIIFDELIGEFALTAWRDDGHELLFARSVCGTRPLYYVFENNRILWSTQFPDLIRASRVDLTIDETYAVQYLTMQPSVRRTPLVGVKTIPPGSMLKVFTDGRIVERSLWGWDREELLESHGDAEYESRCMELLCEAVAVRLRTKSVVFSELSGGLDSSSVVVIADKVLRARGDSIERLQTVSCVFEESQTADERSFVRAVDSWRGVRTFHVTESDQKTTLGLRDIQFTGLPNPLHCFAGRYEKIARIIREQGGHVLLTGVGGDHLFWSDTDGSMLIADHLCNRRILAALRECRMWSRLANVPFFRLLLRRAVALALNSLGLVDADHAAPQIPRWLELRHRDQVLALTRKSVARDISGGIPSKIAQRRMGEDLFQSIAAGYYNEYRSLHITHPFAHRPLVEFCVAAPLLQFLRSGETRSLMRRTLRDLLPPSILKRRSKPFMEEVLTRTAQREWKDVGNPAKWRVCEYGFVVPYELERSLNRMRLGVQLNEVSLLRVLTLERWLRSLDYAHDTGHESFSREALSGVQYS